MDTSSARGETRFVVQIGTETFPVQGSADEGWVVQTAGAGMLDSSSSYASLEEVLFVLINFAVAADGTA